MPDGDPSNNPFVKFKRHVDHHIGATWNGVFSSSSTTSHHPAEPKPEAPPTEETRDQTSPPTPEPNRTLHRPSHHEESMDGQAVDWRQGRFWRHFAAHSPYSPLNLQDLPKPIPQNVPEGVDPRSFTFEDAFEDLLAAASGQQMLSLRRRSEMRDLIHQMFPQGEPSFFWLRRLHSQGLLHNSNYFDRDEFPRYEWHRPRTTEEWVEKKRQEMRDAWEKEEASPTESSEEKGERSPWKEWLDKDIVINPHDMIRRADRAVKNFTKAMEDLGRSEPPRPHANTTEETKPADEKSPETEDDLFSIISSTISEADKSLSTFMKSFANASFKSDVSTSFSKSETFRGSEDDEEDAERTVKNVEEHTDMFGNLHTKTEIKKVNARGEEIGREVHYSVRSVSQSPRPEEESSQETETPTKNTSNTKSSGWFWR